MSLSINTFTAAASADAAAVNAVNGTNSKGNSSGLPFAALLDGQTDPQNAADETEQSAPASIGGVPIDLPPAPFNTDLTAGLSAEDPLQSLLRGLGFGLRRTPGKADGAVDAVLAAFEKEKPDSNAALLLLAVHDVVQRLEFLQRAESLPPQSPQSGNAQAVAAKDAETGVSPQFSSEAMAEGDLSAVDGAVADVLTHTQVPTAAQASTDTFQTLSSASVMELLAKEAAASLPSAQAEAPRVSESSIGHSTTNASANAVVDAIQSVIAQGNTLDFDKGSNQPSMTAGFDRKSLKAVMAAARLSEPVLTFDSTLSGAASEAASTAPSLPNEDGVISSIVQTMRMQMRDGVGTAVVHLEPDYLGPVSISVRVENGVVTASLHAENPQVRAWMEANESVLRENLANQGLTLDRLHVTDERIAEQRSGERRHHQEQEQHARQRQRRDDASTFEVVV